MTNRKAVHTFDRIDRRIVAALQDNASLTNQQLAEQVGLSASPCLRRVRALEEAGIIIGRVTLLDRKKLGLSLTVIIHISMDRHTPERFEEFVKHIEVLEEVQECYLITGQEADYMLKVAIPDMDHYQNFLLNKVTRIPGVSGAHSSFVLQRVLDRTSLPLSYLP